MGKPFEKELKKLDSTYTWAINQDINDLKTELLFNKLYPLYIVGSGGSLSACYYVAYLYQQYGLMAKAVTPLELFYSQNSIPNSNILFVSASGRNTDILFSYKTALSLEPHKILSICMRTGSPLSKIAAENSIGRHFEYEITAGKDGFLATNSLIAFFAIFYKVFSLEKNNIPQSMEVDQHYLKEVELFLKKVNKQFTFNVLAGGAGYPVAVDIESKLVEAALADVIISDYRNFGHGRHHWFAKRKDNSAIIAIITPEEEQLAEKTLSFLPKDIPVLIIRSKFTDAISALDLLVRSFHFINALGKQQNIDPGKPGVPEYGSKLYNLRYNSLLKEKTEIPHLEKIAILRKVKTSSFGMLSEEELGFWRIAYKEFHQNIRKTLFGSIVFDYDGTLCAAASRYTGIEQNVIKALITLLQKGLIIGIATGRGQSVRKDLVEKIPQKFHSSVVVGYYNCSEVILLSENRLPSKKSGKSSPLSEIYDMIKSYTFPEIVCPELKPNQITIEISEKKGWHKVRSTILDLILSKNHLGLQILESSHSIDVIDQASTCKLNILSVCSKLSKKKGKSTNSLCIGDKGQWPGNDYLLLSTPYSLSVDEVSSLKDSCWNLLPAGIKNVKATEYYLSYISFSKTGATITLP